MYFSYYYITHYFFSQKQKTVEKSTAFCLGLLFLLILILLIFLTEINRRDESFDHPRYSDDYYFRVEYRINEDANSQDKEEKPKETAVSFGKEYGVLSQEFKRNGYNAPKLADNVLCFP